MDAAIQERPEHVAEGAPTCRHHWVIASPNGATSAGRCKLCGETKEFRNSSGEGWDRDGSEVGSASWNRSIRSPAAGAVDDGF